MQLLILILRQLLILVLIQFEYSDIGFLKNSFFKKPNPVDFFGFYWVLGLIQGIFCMNGDRKMLFTSIKSRNRKIAYSVFIVNDVYCFLYRNVFNFINITIKSAKFKVVLLST